MSNSGPVPTTLIFLNDLPSLRPGAKVRFLGCATKYTTRTGVLALQHAYPPPPHVGPTALVDVNLLLSTLKPTDIQIGEWVNVIGYVEARSTEMKEGKGCRKAKQDDKVGIRVQAILLWSAGGVKLAEYEKAVEERILLEKGKELEMDSPRLVPA